MAFALGMVALLFWFAFCMGLSEEVAETRRRQQQRDAKEPRWRWSGSRLTRTHSPWHL